MAAGEGLPSDRESLFWLNIMEIPLKVEDPNSVQFAIRQRLKLFYRPPALLGGSAEAKAVADAVAARLKG